MNGPRPLFGLTQARITLRTAALLVAVLPAICISAESHPGSAQARAPSGDIGAVRIITLGTNGGPAADPSRSEPASLLVVDGVPYLVDAGPGVSRQIAFARFELSRIGTIFITHHHIDHDAGLVSLVSLMWFGAAWDGRSAPPVQIYGPPATRFLLQAALNYLSVSERIFRAGVPALAPAASFFQAHDVLGNGEVYRDSRVTVIAVKNTHYNFKSGTAASGDDLSFSYRFNTAHASVVFTGDTGPSEAVTDLARNADVLVSEVCLCDARTQRPALPGSKARARVPAALQREETFHMHHEHLTPEEVGKMAAAAHVKVVILTHFVPGGDKAEPEQYTAGVMKYFSGPVIPAQDLFEYDLR